jgi:hypothetical protein
MEELFLQLKTTEDWQEAVDVAYTYHLLDEARQLNLIVNESGPEIDVERCELLLEAGRARGINLSGNSVEKWAPELRREGFKSTTGARERWLNLFGRRDANKG